MMRSVHPEFRTEVPAGVLTVTGVLPVTASRPTGSVAVIGDLQRLSCDQTLELVDAPLLVVARMDAVMEECLGAPCERGD